MHPDLLRKESLEWATEKDLSRLPGKRPLERPRTRGRDYISALV